MPFTLAHPAAVVPLAPALRRWLGTRGVLSALIVGSMVPDIAFLLPIGISRAQSHSIAGLVWCCLPVGLAVYLAFHWLLKAPLIDLLPHYAYSRLRPYARASAAISWSMLPAVLLCIDIGAVTHIVWDSFTHRDGYAARTLPWLRVHLFTGGGFWMFLYTALQWICSVVGLVLLAWWARRWVAATPQPADAPQSPLSSQARHGVIAAILAVAGVMGAMAAWPHLDGSARALSTQELVSVTLLGWMSGFFLGIVGWALCWRWLKPASPAAPD
jgi:hypothetical protein